MKKKKSGCMEEGGRTDDAVNLMCVQAQRTDIGVVRPTFNTWLVRNLIYRHRQCTAGAGIQIKSERINRSAQSSRCPVLRTRPGLSIVGSVLATNIFHG